MSRKLFDRFVLIIIVCLLSGCTGCNLFEGCHKSSRVVSTETAEEKKEEHRYLTIIDRTNLAINEVLVTTDEGVQIKRIAPLTTRDISIEIGTTWNDYNAFHITFVDVYGLHYEVNFTIPKTGNKVVSVSQDDYVEYKGDWKRLLDKAANGD